MQMSLSLFSLLPRIPFLLTHSFSPFSSFLTLSPLILPSITCGSPLLIGILDDRQGAGKARVSVHEKRRRGRPDSFQPACLGLQIIVGDPSSSTRTCALTTIRHQANTHTHKRRKGERYSGCMLSAFWPYNVTIPNLVSSFQRSELPFCTGLPLLERENEWLTYRKEELEPSTKTKSGRFWHGNSRARTVLSGSARGEGSGGRVAPSRGAVSSRRL